MGRARHPTQAFITPVTDARSRINIILIVIGNATTPRIPSHPKGRRIIIQSMQGASEDAPHAEWKDPKVLIISLSRERSHPIITLGKAPLFQRRQTSASVMKPANKHA